MQTTKWTAVASSGIVALLAAAGWAAAGADGDEDVTICHKPGTPAEKTMEIPRQAWSSHEGHGDHPGACTETSPRSRASPHPVDQPDAPLANVRIGAAGDGRIDGDARFRITVTTQGDAEGVDITAELRGHGAWRLAGGNDRCSIEDDRLSCDVGSMASGTAVTVRLHFDGPPRVCAEPRIVAEVSAANDDRADDNHADVRTRAGACALLDE